MKQIRDISWKYFAHNVDKIAQEIKERKGDDMYENIYGVPRGGLIPAVMLSHALDIPLIVSESDISFNTLICDDILDSGGTLERLFKHIDYKNLDVAVIVLNKTSTIQPTYFGFENKYDFWIHFPYENQEDTVSTIVNI